MLVMPLFPLSNNLQFISIYWSLISDILPGVDRISGLIII